MSYTRTSRTTLWRQRTGRTAPRDALLRASVYAANVSGEDLLADAARISKCFRIRFQENGIDSQDAIQESILHLLGFSEKPQFNSGEWRRKIIWNKCRDICKVAEFRKRKFTTTD